MSFESPSPALPFWLLCALLGVLWRPPEGFLSPLPVTVLLFADGQKPPVRKKNRNGLGFLLPHPAAIPAAQNSSAALHTHRTSVQMAHGRRQGVGVPLSDPLLSSCASRHSHPKEVLSAWTATKAFRPRQSPVRRPVLKTVRARNTAHVCTHRANTVCTRLFGKCRNLLACCCRGLKALRA